MNLYVWTPFLPGLSSDGTAVAVAESVDEARELILKEALVPGGAVSINHSFYTEEETRHYLATEPLVRALPAAAAESGTS